MDWSPGGKHVYIHSGGVDSDYRKTYPAAVRDLFRPEGTGPVRIASDA